MAAGGVTRVSWANLADPTREDWIGAYRLGAADTAYISYRYLSCTTAPGAATGSGACDLALPAVAGTYELRLFRAGTYTRLAVANRVGAGVLLSPGGAPTLTASPGTVAPGGATTATWASLPEPAGGDWIGLYRAGAPDGQHLSYQYLSCGRVPGAASNGGACAVTLPAAAGSYELRLFRAGTYTRVATSATVRVP